MILLLAKLLIARNPALTLQHARRMVTVGLAIAGIVLLIAGFGLWLHFHDKGVIETDRATSNVKALSTAREADERAERAGNRQTEEVEHANDRARDAADGSDDPLKAGLDQLRADRRSDASRGAR